MKYAFIVRHRDVWPTRAMCRAMNVSASGFYEWFGRPASERSLSDARLTRSIRESFELSDRTYGSPRVWHDLRATGEQCGVNRVARLMKLANLQARRKRRRLPGDGATRLENHIAPNHLQREFEALEPNQKWVADFTLYLGGVANSFRRSRRGQHGYYVRPRAWDVDVAPRLTFAPIRDPTVAKASPSAMSLH